MEVLVGKVALSKVLNILLIFAEITFSCQDLMTIMVLRHHFVG